MHSYMTDITAAGVEGLTVRAAVVVHLLEAGGTGAGVRLVAGETQVAAASVVAATAVPAAYRSDRESQLTHVTDYVEGFFFVCIIIVFNQLINFVRNNS